MGEQMSSFLHVAAIPAPFCLREDGYSKEMKLVCAPGTSSDEDRRLTMKAYYSYMLHDRVNSFNYLLRTERFFQLYVVTTLCVVELNMIDFTREHQNDIRNEYLSGGPRYMYAHYLDALAICHVHVVYTIEFQKRGLPHRHTLIWIDERSRIQNHEDIDTYISTELPSKESNPENKSLTGRMSYVHPAAGDLFYQRMLLCHQKGCKSFREIRTVNNVVYPTYLVAYKAMGLIGDDREWETTLQEASLTATSAEL
nr:DNA helicase [Tanacetum cinerariifolium]